MAGKRIQSNIAFIHYTWAVNSDHDDGDHIQKVQSDDNQETGKTTCRKS